MAFEDLREQLLERSAEVMAKIQETSAFNTLRERYESQTPSVQKVIVGAFLAFVAFVFLSIPMSYISSSSDALSQFEENRELIQGLLRASRSSKTPPPLPAPMSNDTLRSRVEQTIRGAGLVPEQIGVIEQIPDSELQGLTPAGVVSTAVVARVKKLNLTQVIEVGNFLQNSAPGLKLIGVDIFQSAGNTHYYDMNVQIANFGIPTFSDSDGDSPDGAKPPPARRSKGASKELEGE